MKKRINHNSNKYDWPVAFAQSYLLIARLACQELLNKSKEKHHRTKHGFTYEISHLYIPVIFNIKHGIELFIKSFNIFIDGTYDKNHNIKKLFKEVKPRILKILKPTNRVYYDNLKEADVIKTKNSLNEVEILIDNFYSLDFLKINKDCSFEDIQNDLFRYPENKTEVQIEWELVLNQLSETDIEQTLKNIDDLYENLNQINYALAILARDISNK